MRLAYICLYFNESVESFGIIVVKRDDIKACGDIKDGNPLNFAL